jgi:hypothetical protein
LLGVGGGHGGLRRGARWGKARVGTEGRGVRPWRWRVRRRR